MNLKRRLALIRLNLEPKIEIKLVPICSKLELDKRENTAQVKSKSELKNNEGCCWFSDLKPSLFYLKFSANFSLCAACFYAIDQQQVRLLNPGLAIFKFLF